VILFRSCLFLILTSYLGWGCVGGECRLEGLEERESDQSEGARGEGVVVVVGWVVRHGW
jgi:hypothetical protein